jgi:hypothetical protein
MIVLLENRMNATFTTETTNWLKCWLSNCDTELTLEEINKKVSQNVVSELQSYKLKEPTTLYRGIKDREIITITGNKNVYKTDTLSSWTYLFDVARCFAGDKLHRVISTFTTPCMSLLDTTLLDFSYMYFELCTNPEYEEVVLLSNNFVVELL